MAQSILEESRKKRSAIRQFIFSKKAALVFIIILLLAGAYYYYNSSKTSQAAVVQVKKWTVKKEDIKIAVQSDGKVTAKDGVELSFPVSGNLEVKDVYVKEGDKVKKGDKIAAVKTESLEFELRNAYASYQSALASLSSKQAGPTDSELSKAQTTIDQAQVSLSQATISLEQVKSSASQQITNAASALLAAENSLKLNSNARDSAIVKDAYSSLLDSIKSVSVLFQRALHDADNILGIDDLAVNDEFESVLGVKNSATLATAKFSYLQAKALKLDLDSSLLSLNSSDNGALDSLALKTKQALSLLQSQMYDMQNLLDATIVSANLSQTKLDSFKSTINSDRSSVNSSLSSLNNATQAVNNAETSLNGLQISYNKALNDLAATKKQSERDINNATITLKSREISLSQAENDYKALVAPVRAVDLASARAQLTSAAISVDRAKYNVAQATLISPIDGVIAQLNYKKGDIILDSSTSKTVVSIINNDTLFIEANIEEADVSKLKVGDKADVTFDAVDGVKLNGEVSFISLTSETSANGIVTYLVRVLLTNTGGSQIREGMTASINFITAQALDVLSVPVEAVRNVGGNPAVEMVDHQFTTVISGFTDGKKVEIISGLKEGDVILY
ncbi:MAG: HlyD family efflux transporter periplasmic adaptor subunit [Patescibacteria group bacterium]